VTRPPTWLPCWPEPRSTPARRWRWRSDRDPRCRDPGLGNRTYLASDGHSALVVDPPSDYERVLDALREKGWHLTHVFETHVHNDYVTGGPALAAAAGADYVVNAAEGLGFPHVGVTDGDVIAVGGLRVGVMAAPGHTPHHLAFVLGLANGELIGVFTGGSLLYGTTGRTDLIGEHVTEWLTRCQWRTAHRIAGHVPDYGEVWPTHGFGSLCAGAAGSGATSSTIGDERHINPALVLDEPEYVSALIAGLGAYPTYVRPKGGSPGKRGHIETWVNNRMKQIDRFPQHGWSDAAAR
jgi:glyoxylase-like metal-dependent hydrolase (beta-lactamase superfamily II)